MKKLVCLRCGGTMRFLMREKFQKGESGAWVGNLNFKFRGGFEMDVYSCPECGKLEFYMPNDQNDISEAEEADASVPGEADITHISKDGIPQIRCPACGRTHDFDYPKCPYCGYTNH